MIPLPVLVIVIAIDFELDCDDDDERGWAGGGKRLLPGRIERGEEQADETEREGAI